MHYNTLFLTLITVTTVASYINYRYIKMPKTIFLTISSFTLSLVISIMFKLMPNIFKHIYSLLSGINFRHTILDVMLGYLLFAGSLRVNSINLRREVSSVVYLASVGVIISTCIIGSILWLLTYYVNIHLPYSDCLIFGALISPIDAIAVISIIRNTTRIPLYIQSRITGESLFNDAAGIMLLVILTQIFYPIKDMSYTLVFINLLREIGGGFIWGFIVGKFTIITLKKIDENELVLLTTITASGLGYLIAHYLHLSAVISVVIAGLYVGGHNRDNNFTKITTTALKTFWELIDDILNAFVFVLIGLEMLTINFSITIIVIGTLSVILIFVARYISIYLPDLILIKIFHTETKSRVTNKERILMSWGGVRGGISIALAWSIANISSEVLSITYVVVVSSILIQGSTLKIITKKLFTLDN